MLVRDLKKRLGELGMEYIETWIPPSSPTWKAVEIFFTEEQIEQRYEGEATSMFCAGGWPDAEERLKQIGIL